MGNAGLVTPNVGRPQAGSNFSLGFLFMSKPKRRALQDVYGFCRFVDDIVDSGALPKEGAAAQLDFWRGEIEKLFEGNPTHPLSRRLLPHVREFRLPKEGFLELINGVGMDLDKTRYETFAELEKYLFGVAGAVGLLCVEIFGYRHTLSADIRQYAITMGNAFQLTNILRDVGSDLERGRIYLPLEDIREAGYSVEAFIRREYTPQFMRLMGMEYARAKECYRKAKNLLAAEDRPSQVPGSVMAAIYEAVLDKTREEQFRVFFQKVRLPWWRKASLAFQAWLHAYGIY